MNTEELRIILRTVADTSGAKQTQQALRQTEQIARQTQQAPKSSGPTSVSGGLSEIAAAGAVGGVAAAAANKLAGSLGDVMNIYGSSVNVLREHERLVRATSMAYGQAAKDYTDFAEKLSSQTGFASDSILEAALSARTLSQNYGLTIQQTQKLIAVSADLARVRGIGIAEAFERVQSAIRGEAEASEYLGLTLNDTYLTNQAMNGSLRTTFGTMTDLEKAQVRYNELLKQSAQFAGLAAGASDSLDASFGRTEKSVRRLATAFGEFAKGPSLAGLDVLKNFANIFAEGFEGKDTNAVRFRKFLEEFGKNITAPGAALVPSIQDAATAAGKAQQLAQLQVEQQRELKRLRDATDTLPPVTTDADLRRIALMDQVGAAVRDATEAQSRQLELQRRSVDLAAEEAQIRLSMLPAQQEMAELQRRMTESQIQARRAALPATEALEDLRFAQQRAQLISQNRNVGVDQRIAARRDLRAIGRALPGAELAALDAGRPVTLAERGATRLGMEAQLFEISTQRQLVQVEQAQITNGLLSQIAAQRTQAIELTINLGTEEFQKEVFKQLVEANNQAQGPTVVKLSGVRR